MANRELVALVEGTPQLVAPTASDTGTLAGALEVTGTLASGALSVTGPASATTGMAVGGATAGAGGVAFPATAVAVADANTLDDYEEGTFTPTLKDSASGNEATYDSRAGKYTKTGNVVYFSFQTDIADIAGMTGGNAAIFGGLPFVNAAVAGGWQIPQAAFLALVTFTGFVVADILSATSNFNLSQITSGNAADPLNVTEISGAGRVQVRGSYYIS